MWRSPPLQLNFFLHNGLTELLTSIVKYGVCKKVSYRSPGIRYRGSTQSCRYGPPVHGFFRGRPSSLRYDKGIDPRRPTRIVVRTDRKWVVSLSSSSNSGWGSFWQEDRLCHRSCPTPFPYLGDRVTGRDPNPFCYVCVVCKDDSERRGGGMGYKWVEVQGGVGWGSRVWVSVSWLGERWLLLDVLLTDYYDFTFSGFKFRVTRILMDSVGPYWRVGEI